MSPTEEQKAYKQSKKFPIKCVECKQAKTYLDVSTGRYSDYEKGIVTAFSERVPTYCYMTKRKINDRKQICIIPMHENNEVNERFIRDNKIMNHQPSSLEIWGKPVFISLSGRKYHTAECTQIKGKKIFDQSKHCLSQWLSPMLKM